MPQASSGACGELPSVRRRTPTTCAAVRRVRAADAASRAEATLSLGVAPDRAEEVDVPEVRPERLAEVELAQCALPEQEATEALLTRRTNDQVRVRLALRVQVPGDVFDVDAVGQLLDRHALRGFLEEQRADRVGELTPSAVPDGDVDEQA